MRTTAVLVLLALAANSLLAHPGHEVDGFGHGLGHPFGGLDHLIAMLAVGLLGAWYAGRWRWLLPLAFLAGLALGGLTAGFALALPAVEMSIALSVVIFGLILCFAGKLSPGLALTLIALAGLPHGHAHLSEAGTGSLLGYGGGMLIGSALLHALGLVAGIGIAAMARQRDRWRYAAGSLIASAGCALVIMLSLT